MLGCNKGLLKQILNYLFNEKIDQTFNHNHRQNRHHHHHNHHHLTTLQVSAFSTWEKELHKIVFDPRYLLLASKERKQVFEQYMKERAEEERKEKKNKLKEKKEAFKSLMQEAKLTSK